MKGRPQEKWGEERRDDGVLSKGTYAEARLEFTEQTPSSSESDWADLAEDVVCRWWFGERASSR